MAYLVVSGAVIHCYCGTEPSRLFVPPTPFLPDMSPELPTINYSLDVPVDGSPTIDLSLAIPAIQAPKVMLPQFGVFEESYPNGNLAIQMNFEEGLLEGPCLVFDRDGGIVAKLNFHLGKLQGPELPAPKITVDMDFDFDLDIGGAFAASRPMATVKDHIPNLNIRPFGLCKSSGNPGVKKAGKPVPCTPKTETPWIPGSTVHVTNEGTSTQTRVLNDASVLTCAHGCIITVLDPGQSTVKVP